MNISKRKFFISFYIEIRFSVLLVTSLIQCLLRCQGVIEARMESFNSAHAFGLSLVDQGHFAAEEIKENCDELNLVKDELMESWEEKQIELSQSYELQV